MLEPNTEMSQLLKNIVKIWQLENPKKKYWYTGIPEKCWKVFSDKQLVLP